MNYRPSIPEPLWVGWFLRTARCECGSKFRGRRAREEYEAHWRAAHELDAYGNTPVYEHVDWRFVRRDR